MQISLSHKILFGYLFSMAVIISMVVLTGCRRSNNGFSSKESRLIHSGEPEEIMRLYTVEDQEDSLLLRKVSRPLPESAFFSEEYGLLVGRMLATVFNPENEGVGIAAPQVGILRRIIAVQRFDKEDEPFEIFVNPEIVRRSEERQSGEEGCLSLPDVSGCVSRAKQVTLRYLDGRTFEKREEVIDGFTAIIVQHEIDHLDGRFFTDLLLPDENNRNTVPEILNMDK
ncbi:peptide deformylase [Phocaeicola faecalis]